MKWLVGLAVLVLGILGMAGADLGTVVAPVTISPASGPAHLTAGQEAFADALAELPFCVSTDACGYLPVDVARAWALAEGGGVAAGQPANNFLFLSCIVGPCATLDGREWATFTSSVAAAAAVWAQLQGSPLYAGVVTAVAMGLGDLTIMEAIATSPWDAGHYTDAAGELGAKLFGPYDSIIGAPPQKCLLDAVCVP